MRDKFQQANLNLWNELTVIHAASEDYAVEDFKAGKTQLNSIELEELGDVDGKSMLHLQCHFGRDSMMWARLGAKVTGVDFSDKAITLARQLNQELDLGCEFIQSDVLDLIGKIDQQFDIVFTSYGVLVWLSDLEVWGEMVAHYLKPGGVFYIAEIHPFSMILEDEQDKSEWGVRYPYFHDPKPLKFDTQGSYVDRSAHVEQSVNYEWAHSISDIISALTHPGLHIEYMHEFDFTVYKQFPFLQKKNGYWHLPAEMVKLPLLFSLKAHKPE